MHIESPPGRREGSGRLTKLLPIVATMMLGGAGQDKASARNLEPIDRDGPSIEVKIQDVPTAEPEIVDELEVVTPALEKDIERWIQESFYKFNDTLRYLAEDQGLNSLLVQRELLDLQEQRKEIYDKLKSIG